MQKPLNGMKAAILVANGFNEKEMTTFQRGLMEAGATPKIISVENGLANGWQAAGPNNVGAWGHYFAVDCPLSDALAADFDMLVIPSGQRSLDKLKLSAHARRFIGGFMAGCKPMMVLGEAISLLMHTGYAKDVMVTGPEPMKAQAIEAGAHWSENCPTIDGHVMTCVPTDDVQLKELVDTLVNLRISQMEEERLEAA